MRLRHIFLGWLFCSPGIGYGQSDYKDLFELSLDQLVDLQVTDTVTQAAKWQSKSHDLPFSISFIKPFTHYSPLLHSIRDVDHRATSLVVSEYNQVTPQLYIRGIGSNSSGAGDDPSVAYLMNGTDISRPGFHNPILFDIQRIEILKGPQGSLYGKGVIGGAVNMVAAAPDIGSDFSNLSFSAKDNGWDFFGVSNITLGRHSANRVSIVANDNQGYVENHGTGHELGSFKNLAFREQFLWQTKTQKLALFFEYNALDSVDPAYSYHGDAPFAGQFPIDLTPFRNKDFDVEMPDDPESERDFYFSSLRYEMETGYGRWVSITAYNTGDYSFELDFLPINYIPNANIGDENAWQASQEIRLEHLDDSFSWNIGAYLSRERIERKETANVIGLVNLLGFGGALTEDTPGVTTYDAEQDITNGALFFHSRWQFIQDWFLTLGLRSDHITKDFKLAATGGDPLNITLMDSLDFSMDTDKSWSENAYTIALSRQLAKDVMAYGRISTGFKAGNFNSLAISEQASLAASKPEEAINKELGIKGFYFDRRLELNLAIFDTEYKNLQVFSGLESEFNAPKADIRGIDLETRAKISKGLEITANYTYLDTRFHNFTTPGNINLKNKRLPRAPEHSFALNTDYSWSDSVNNRYWFHWQLSYTGEWYITPTNAPSSKTQSYAVNNLSFSWEPNNTDMQISLWSKNVFNKAYSLHTVDQTDFSYTTKGSAYNMAPPRTVGVSVHWTIH